MKIVVAKKSNVNDESMTVVEWRKNKSEEVTKGEIIGSVETTKSIFDLESEEKGYFYPLVERECEVEIGAPLYAIATSIFSEEELNKKIIELTSPVEDTKIESKNYTKKAEILAKKNNIDIASLQLSGVIQESDIQNIINTKQKSCAKGTDLIDDLYKNSTQERILIIGAGEAASLAASAVTRCPHQRIAGLVDDNPNLLESFFMGHPILGKISSISKLYKENKFDKLVIAFGNNIKKRTMLYDKYSSEGIPFANIIDPDARIDNNVSMGSGNIILAFSRIGPCASIGNNNLLSTYVNIEHHNVLNSHCTFGPGVLMSGQVTIGNSVRFGTGVFVEPGVTIGDDAIIASGAILASDIPKNHTVKCKIEITIREIKKKSTIS